MVGRESSNCMAAVPWFDISELAQGRVGLLGSKVCIVRQI